MRHALLVIPFFLMLFSPIIAASAQTKPCLIVKHKGTVGRRFMWFALIGVPIAPGSKYDYVDSINYESKKLKYGAKDLQKVQDSGVHVIILNKEFAAADLESARKACVDPTPAAGILPAAGESTAPEKPRPIEAQTLGVAGYEDAVGFRVASVRADSPAEFLFIHPGDIITKIDGQSVRNATEIEAALAEHKKPTFKVNLLVQTVSVGVVAAEREAKMPTPQPIDPKQ